MQRRLTIVGRREQVGILDTAYQEATDGGRFVLVTGPAGSGRTALVQAASDGWRAAGAAVLHIAGGGAHDPVAGFATLLHALREQYEQLADPLLGRPLSAIGALCADPDAPARPALLAQQTAAAFGVIARRTPVVLVADDIDDSPGLTTALAAAVRNRCLVVTTARRSGGRPGALAHRVIDLPPLDAAATREMLARRHGAPLDDAVLPALTAALGPLAGHPSSVVETADALAGAGRLAVVEGHLCLLDPHSPIALPPGHRLVTSLRERGAAAVRIATMAAVTRLRLDDLPLFADATLGRSESYGRVVDELTEDGVLVTGPQRELRPRCPSLSTRLIDDAGPVAVTRLHRAYAAAMFRRATASTDRAALADHVANAGPAMPTDRRTAVHLAATAAEVTDREPGRAADWLRAALWHAGGGRAAEDILSRLLRLLVRTGQFTRLAEVVRAAAQSGPTGELAQAAALASVHTGIRMADLLDGKAPETEALDRLSERWLRGIAAPGPHTGVAVFDVVDRAIGHGLGPSDGPADELLTAGADGDLAALLRLVLGEQGYGVPSDGPLAAYHRLHNCHADGDLPGVVSAAREVETHAGEALLVRRLARLWAAEALTLLGRPEESMSWLSSVPDAAPYAALRWWAGNSTAAPAERLRAARTAYDRQRAHGSRIGVEQLLVRATELAVRSGLTAEARAFAALAEDGGPSTVSTGTRMLVQALVTGDQAVATVATGVLRARGHRPALGLAVLAFGRVAADPRPWLLEAQEIAEAIGAPGLRSEVAAVMRERAVLAHRPRSAREAFSDVEVQIIELIRKAHTNRQIAARIKMSEKTVENYLTRLFARTGCRSRVELAAVSLTNGLTG